MFGNEYLLHMVGFAFVIFIISIEKVESEADEKGKHLC